MSDSTPSTNALYTNAPGSVITDVGVSLDGYLAGPHQSLENPMGERAAEVLHRWMFEQPEANERSMTAITDHGAFVMGRNMFGPVRGDWDSSEEWRGWWGDNPPYHGPVFVLSHYPREPLVMEGGTTFYFVTDGPEAALALAREAAGGRSISVAGGAETVRQYLALGAIDTLRLHVAPVVLGAGESIFTGMESLQLEPLASETNELVTHVAYRPVR
ncbi:dihydrofolate reductase family protein [Psychromicrobium xiongbiense]|uniref:dihydrofolate reductase family protein n=1 Tax=Psychromicrobium xiongbiense TaxID=3051184 RepID=UPI0025526E03|nr:dihydrofolate reductase family protein [Psychromicrobium sp. YIM S02556]